MRLIFSEQAWEDYLYWQKTDKQILKRVNKLIGEVLCTRQKIKRPNIVQILIN